MINIYYPSLKPASGTVIVELWCTSDGESISRVPNVDCLGVASNWWKQEESETGLDYLIMCGDELLEPGERLVSTFLLHHGIAPDQYFRVRIQIGYVVSRSPCEPDEYDLECTSEVLEVEAMTPKLAANMWFGWLLGEYLVRAQSPSPQLG